MQSNRDNQEQWEQILISKLSRQIPEIEIGQKLVEEFHQLMTKRQPECFRRWLEKARASEIGEIV